MVPTLISTSIAAADFFDLRRRLTHTMRSETSSILSSCVAVMIVTPDSLFKRFQQFDNGFAGFLIQVSGRFIGQNNRRIVGQSCAQSPRAAADHPTTALGLLCIRWPSSTISSNLRPFSICSSRLAPAKIIGSVIFSSARHHRNQVESLENIADFATTQPRQFKSIQLRQIDFVDENGAIGRLIQATDHVEQASICPNPTAP